MRQYWTEYWMANYGCIPDGLDLMIIFGMITIIVMLTR
tara:strand:+ start:269 stop:382 length:114 start_codon:yes stop_codon:yes gene_type:complete